MSLVHLRAAGTSLLLDAGGPGLPRVLHWGADLGELPLDDDQATAVRAAVVPATPRSALDQPMALSVLPTEADGWSGAPGVAGHRDGAGAHPVLRLRDAESTSGPDGGGRVVARAGDDAAGLDVEVTLTLDVHGVLSVSAAVTNTGAGVYDLAALRPLLPLPHVATEVLDTTGRWCREGSPQHHSVQHGTWWRPSRRGRTGHDGPLFVAVGTAGFGFGHGEVWAAHLAWSGDSEYLVERLPEGAGPHASVVAAAELLRPGELRLAPGESYRTPDALFSYSRNGLDGVAQRWHRWQRARSSHPRSPRPVVLNTWEAVYFDHDLQRLRRLADVAASIGVERFVLDDGWFRGRRDDTAGLGDWYVDPDVWPEGLHPLVDHVRALGLQVGLWVEPEMVNLDSDVAREHPEWVLRPHEGAVPPPWRNQQVIDLTNPDAWAYLLERLDALVSEYALDYLKWDHNRDLHAAGSTPSYGPVVHQQTQRLYALLDELRRRHPSLEIESCASGGARVDLGILAHTDRVWASDCNDAVERQHIQRWTTQVLAPELVGAHAGPPVAHTTHRAVDLPMRLATALFGHAGLEWDLTSLDADELQQVTDWIAFYRRLRGLLHSGDVVRGDLPDDGALLHGVVARDRSEAVLAYVRLTTAPGAHPGLVRLPGLDPLRQYDVSVVRELGEPATVEAAGPGWWDGTGGSNGTVSLPGSVLGAVGLTMPVLAPASALVLHLRAR
ncbi:alpha-galactosidase [Angustibacter sp. Root456]|uniref:alpha-galactosidase n=1 Tax=Angustibacter sp. Root456 TaxID=1736539 RepID=UPI000701B12C|nr:alpha-galactosidase [Angustibacter sp. Root456]KQX70008.1 alpha-galactosidase [Angustibacter sp. Root456]